MDKRFPFMQTPTPRPQIPSKDLMDESGRLRLPVQSKEKEMANNQGIQITADSLPYSSGHRSYGLMLL